MRYLLFILLWMLMAPAGTEAQQREFITKNFTQEDGLPSNECYCVFEDRQHFIWIGTDHGVVRYNGNKFETFDLPDNVVFKIMEDPAGRTWFFTYRGLAAYFENEKMHPFIFNDRIASRIKSIHIKDVAFNNDGSISLSSTLDTSYVIRKDGSIDAFNHYSNFPGTIAFTITVKENNRCFTQIQQQPSRGTHIAITVIRNGSKKVFNTALESINSSQFASIAPNDKEVYFFYGATLFKIDNTGGFKMKQMPSTILTLHSFQHKLLVGLGKGGVVTLDETLNAVNLQLLPGKSITSICEDFENGIWFTSLENGAYYVKNPSITHFIFSGQNDQAISRLYVFNDSTLIFGTSEGLFTFDGKNARLLAKEFNRSIANIFYEDHTLFCMGAFDNFYSKIIPEKGPVIRHFFFANNPTIQRIFIKDTILTSTTNSVVKFRSSFIHNKEANQQTDEHLNGETKQLLAKPAILFSDKQNNLWAGTNDGLYKSASPYDSLYLVEKTSRFLKDKITFITQLSNGVMVLAVNNAGIGLLLRDTITYINEQNGLLSNKVSFILPLNNKLWVATSKGISVVSIQSFKPLQIEVSNIGKEDGFYNNKINHLVAFENKLAVATNNGLYIIEQPDSFLNRRPPPLPMYVSKISYYRGDTGNISSLTIPYAQNGVLIKCKAISFSAFESIHFQYQSDAEDTVWHTTTSSEFLFENLQPGTYPIQIRAVIPSQGSISPIVQFSITVEKPWWQNNWFRLLAMLLLAAPIYLYLRYRINKVKQEEKRKTALNNKLAELEQTALRSQMNPHFIFNCLTSIQQLIISGNKADANDYLVKFARLIRKTLELSAQPFISIREETDYLKEYLVLEQLRLEGKFDFRITSDPGVAVDKTYIPNMMIQPVVENCIRHGIKSLEQKKGVVTITFQKDDQVIHCTVTDNGVGRRSTLSQQATTFTKHKSYGMDIVKKRLEAYSDDGQQQTGIEIEDLVNEDGTPAGTKVTLILPYKNEP